MFLLRETFRVLGRIKGRVFLLVLLLTLLGTLAGGLALFLHHTPVLWQVLNNRLPGELFLSDTADSTTIRILETKLRNDRRIVVTAFRSKEEARREFAREFGEDIFTVLESNPLPASWVFHFRGGVPDSLEIQRFVSDYEELPGVLEVRVPARLLVQLGRRFGELLFSLTILFLVVLSLLVLITWFSVRRAVALHGRELEIMLLMGAGEAKIRAPFLLGGLLYTSAAAVFSSLLVRLLVLLAERVVPREEGSGALIAAFLTVFLVGWGGSYFSLRRELKRRLTQPADV
jgi:cell division transport system permease protein